GVNFGVAVVQGLRDGTIDGFFANGMGAELAIREGLGTLVLDVRRGLAPPESFHYTMPAVATTEAMLAEQPETAAKVVRALIKTQALLTDDVGRATQVGERLFPAF